MSNAALRLAPSARALSAEIAPRVVAVDVALPVHRYDQEDLWRELERRWSAKHHNVSRLARFHESVAVSSRCLALPLEAYRELASFGDANDAFIRVGTEMGARAVRGALAASGLAPTDVDIVFFTTVTGLATPTLDARLANVLGLRPDVKRVPMFGLGCVGGAAGLARASDYLRAFPDDVAVLLSVELCSLTLQEDFSVANLIATGLFGDGAAGVALVGAGVPCASSRRRRTPAVLATRSVLFPDTERVMGWDIGSGGFKVVLSAAVPELARRELPVVVDAFLADHGLSRSDIRRWVCHPGGPRVIEAIEEALELEGGALADTRLSLSEFGNLSSASVLDVLARTTARAEPGELGLLVAMGPGFCAELVLLSW